MKRAAAYGTTVMAGALCFACWFPQNDDGKPAGVFSCSEIEETTTGPKVIFCSESLGYDLGQAKAQQTLCNSETAGTGKWTFAYAPCTHDGALGGCRYKNSGPTYVYTDWYYANGDLPWPADASESNPNLGDGGYGLCLSNQIYISP